VSYPYKLLSQIRAQFLLKFIVRRDKTVPNPGRKDPVPDLLKDRRRVDELLQIAQLQGQQELLDLLVRQLLDEKPDVLRDKLRDPNPTVRWLTAQVVGRRRLPLEPELIGLLDDREPEVVQAARQALVRLGRGTDFGPSRAASRAERRRAAERWRDWLALQDRPTRKAAPRLEMIPYRLAPEGDSISPTGR
jgi:HEAT repeat protein